ncbi:MAG TPA: biotin--[acetyl-CoA-carboxylase] ligase [Acidobacteriaceae bacterium]|jgi:BirA family biotin operon repressor/biotin-[acetyl-CoA-carboxylase] ligase|nr:biotin--[acetyl-CoA-carboxylase] ligase [Acidobacteriaceae bacterium]
MSVYDIAALHAALQGTLFEGKLHHFRVVDSTNVVALEAAQEGAASGSVYFANEQTAGRGRGGHTWHSAAGDGMYASVLLRPSLAPAAALKISLAAGLAARAAIAEVSGLQADIRWPNDLMLDGRKCGGILVDTAATGDAERLRHVVIGVGINVNHEAFPDDLRYLATSLRIESGAGQSVQALLAALLRNLASEMTALETGDAVLERFAAASTWVRGKRVHVESVHGKDGDGYTGITNGLDVHGFLRILTESGAERLVLSGGVREITED